MQSATAKDLLDELNDLQVKIIELWKVRKLSTEYGMEYTWQRLQDELRTQREIATELMDLGYSLEELNLFVPMDENLV